MQLAPLTSGRGPRTLRQRPGYLSSQWGRITSAGWSITDRPAPGCWILPRAKTAMRFPRPSEPTSATLVTPQQRPRPRQPRWRSRRRSAAQGTALPAADQHRRQRDFGGVRGTGGETPGAKRSTRSGMIGCRAPSLTTRPSASPQTRWRLTISPRDASQIYWPGCHFRWRLWHRRDLRHRPCRIRACDERQQSDPGRCRSGSPGG